MFLNISMILSWCLVYLLHCTLAFEQENCKLCKGSGVVEGIKEVKVTIPGGVLSSFSFLDDSIKDCLNKNFNLANFRFVLFFLFNKKFHVTKISFCVQNFSVLLCCFIQWFSTVLWQLLNIDNYVFSYHCLV